MFLGKNKPRILLDEVRQPPFWPEEEAVVVHVDSI
jgi:hypothetical protein